MIKVLVGESNSIFRRGLTEILNEQTGMQVLDEVTTQKELLEKAKANSPDVVVLDFMLPGRQTLDMVKAIKAENPSLPVVLMGDKGAIDADMASRVLRAGATVFVFKSSPTREIIGAIHGALVGRRYIAAELAQVLALKSLDPTAGKPAEILSDREIQVLTLIASGRTLKEIAGELSLSYNTINTYRQRVMEKLELSSTADLIRYAFENRLVR